MNLVFLFNMPKLHPAQAKVNFNLTSDSTLEYAQLGQSSGGRI